MAALRKSAQVHLTGPDPAEPLSALRPCPACLVRLGQRALHEGAGVEGTLGAESGGGEVGDAEVGDVVVQRGTVGAEELAGALVRSGRARSWSPRMPSTVAAARSAEEATVSIL